MARERASYAHVNRAITVLTPFAKNARTHGAVQIAKLVASIKEYGFTNPLLIDEKDAVLAGYGRMMAAQNLQMTTVPCIVVSGLSAKQKRALMIADNRIALESAWDQDLLIETLGEISADGTDLTLTGFDLTEVDLMLSPSASLDEDSNDADGKPAAAPSITITVPNAIDIPSVAAILRKALSGSGYKGVKVREPK